VYESTTGPFQDTELGTWLGRNCIITDRTTSSRSVAGIELRSCHVEKNMGIPPCFFTSFTSLVEKRWYLFHHRRHQFSGTVSTFQGLSAVCFQGPSARHNKSAVGRLKAIKRQLCHLPIGVEAVGSFSRVVGSIQGSTPGTINMTDHKKTTTWMITEQNYKTTKLQNYKTTKLRGRGARATVKRWR
jgi:hypothetical protein